MQNQRFKQQSISGPEIWTPNRPKFQTRILVQFSDRELANYISEE